MSIEMKHLVPSHNFPHRLHTHLPLNAVQNKRDILRMWTFIKMLVLFNLFVLGSNSVHGEWVEIPQFSSNRKSYLVTPYNPYIYEQSSVFTSTTPTPYGTLFEPRPQPPTFFEEKKSITKVPDTVFKSKFATTEMPSTKYTTLKYPKVHTDTKSTKKSNSTPHSRVQTTPSYNSAQSKISSKRKRIPPQLPTTTTTEETPTIMPDFPKISQVILDEHDFDEEAEIEDETSDDELEEEEEEPEEEEYDDDREFDDDEDMGSVGDDYYDDNEYGEDQREDGEATQKGAGESNGFSYVSFMPYLQNIQSTLIKNSHKNTKSKVSFLVEIRDRLLYAIKQKIASIWPSGNRRQTRSARGDHWDKGETDVGHGNEGALLTLGFLTFATFLVKCILKLVHHLKSDKGGYYHHHHMRPNVYPIVINATGIGRKRREIDEKAIDILSLIEQYKVPNF